MIANALNLLKDDLEQHLRSLPKTSECSVKLGMVARSTTIPPPPGGLVILNLIHQQEESAAQVQSAVYQAIDSPLTTEPTKKLQLRISIIVMFAMHFENYEESLNCLSEVLGFFQNRSGFEFEPAALNRGITRRSNVEMLSLGCLEQARIWALLGSAQIPAACYRIYPLVLESRLEDTALSTNSRPSRTTRMEK